MTLNLSSANDHQKTKLRCSELASAKRNDDEIKDLFRLDLSFR